MESTSKRWLSNSAANIIGGVANAGISLLLPAVVVKHITPSEFSLWNLSLQIIVYVNLLGMGLQTATARAIARTTSSNGQTDPLAPATVRAARSIANISSLIAIILVVGLVIGYPLLFPGVPPSLLTGFRITLGLLGLAAVGQILAQVDMGIFQGLHRNFIFVGVQTTVRALSVLAVGLGASLGGSLVTLAALMSASTILLWPAMRAMARHLLPWARHLTQVPLDRRLRTDLLKYCGTLSVWSVSMLLVNSVGILIVGRIDLPMAGPYALAMTAASVFVGLLNAALSPLMTSAASLHATEEGRKHLPNLLSRSTLGAAIALNAMIAATLVLYPFVLRVWVGENFVQSAGPLVVALCAGHCLRNIGAPYALMLLASGLQRRAMVSALLEGLSNLLASYFLGIHWGALGVACGTLVGAVIGLIGTLILNTHQTPELTPRPIQFAVKAVLLPLIAFLPLQIFLLNIH